MEKELIVARYKEPVDWCLSSPIPCTLYNKGDALDLDAAHVDVIALPNQGREAGTWLEHCIRNYDDGLADWSFFVQGSPHQGVEELWKRLAITYQDTTPLTREYLPWHPSPEVKSKDRVEVLEGGIEVHWGLADPTTTGQCDACSSPCDALWAQYFDCPRPTPWWFGYGASYAVPRARILARPLSYWLWLRDIVNKSDNVNHVGIHNAWSMEMLFGYFWADADLYPGRKIPPRRMTVAEAREKGLIPMGCNSCGGGNAKRAANK